MSRAACFSMLLLLAGCAESPREPAAAQRAGCIQSFDPEKDYFSDKATVEFARNFSVEYHKSYKVVTVHSSESKTPEQYVLLRCGAPKPVLSGELSSAPVISVPITSMFSDSATHMP